MSESILDIRDVSKHYRNKKALDGITFTVKKGGILGLLGPNGAGKTTLIRIITRINQADAGSIFFNDEPLQDKHTANTGYLPEERGLYKKMGVYEHLIYLARLKGLSKQQAEVTIESWFDRFDIADWRNKKIEELSKGMQQKVQFIAAVITNPQLLILDEPFSGLDPLNTNLIKSEIIKLNEKGTSIIFSTHRMNQVEEICNEIVLIHEGKVLIHKEIQSLRQQFKQNIFKYTLSQDSFQDDVFDRQEIIRHNEDEIWIRHRDLTSSNQFLSELIDRGITVISYEEVLPSLDDIFVHLIKAES